MINVIVFSKDRAAQLELLLRSFKQFFKEWEMCTVSIIYKASNEEFQRGYRLCEKLHPEFSYVDEDTCESFRSATLSGFDNNNPLTFFLVDDIIFKEPISLEDEEFARAFSEPNVLCLSLRMSKLCNYCYPISQFTPVPETIQQGQNTWTWINEQGDWGYPLSVDGNVFPTELIKLFAENLPYHNPNSFEAHMSANTHVVKHLPLMMCYRDNSRLLNVPANRVQETFANRTGNLVSAEELNQRFLDGSRISLEPFVGLKNTSPHEEHPFLFEKTL